MLDVGCWDGLWSFYAEQRGVKEVLATDDVSQNWSDDRGLRMARDLLKSEIEIRQDLSIYRLTSLNRTFDIIVCLGVYYHPADPFYAFSQIRHCCHPRSLVLLEGDVAIALPPNHVAHTFCSSGIPVLLPSNTALKNLLEQAYLRVTMQVWSGPHYRLRAWLARLRHGRTVSRRVFTVCAPFEGANQLNPFCPPFGLSAYDERFRDGGK